MFTDFVTMSVYEVTFDFIYSVPRKFKQFFYGIYTETAQ